MKNIKTIALALAISTGACTMHAGGQQVEQRSIGSVVNNIFKFSAASALAYVTTQRITYKQFVQAMSDIHTAVLKGDGQGFLDRFGPKLDFWANMYDNEDMLKPAFLIGRTFSFLPAYKIYRGMLNRILG